MEDDAPDSRWSRSPYASDDEGTPKPYKEISTAECFIILLLVLPIEVFFYSYEHEAFKGFVAAISAGAVIGLIWVLRPLRHHGVFWLCICAAALFHLVILVFLPYSGDFRFGFAFFPVAALDFYVWARLIIWACGARFQS